MGRNKIFYGENKCKCGRCKKVKDISEFWVSNGKPAGYCKKCAKLYRQENKQRVNKEAEKWRYKNLYGITFKDYEELFEKQEGRCAICNKHQNELNRKLSVDHDHKTGKVRGLLCDHCNHGIGKFNDDIENIKRLLNYLLDNQ